MANEQRSQHGRIGIIKTVQTPLGFFVLVILVVEVVLGALAGKSSGSTLTLIVVGMLIIILALIAVVAYFAYYRPEALVGGRPPAKTSESDEALLALMHCYSKEILTVVRVDSSEGKIVNAKIVGANEKALHFFGFRANQADQFLGQPASFLFDRLSRWMSKEHLRAFIKDQERTFADIVCGYEAYAMVSMIIDDRHPFDDLHGRRFLPISISHSRLKTTKGNREEDILVSYLEIDKILNNVPLTQQDTDPAA